MITAKSPPWRREQRVGGGLSTRGVCSKSRLSTAHLCEIPLLKRNSYNLCFVLNNRAELEA